MFIYTVNINHSVSRFLLDYKWAKVSWLIITMPKQINFLNTLNELFLYQTSHSLTCILCFNLLIDIPIDQSICIHMYTYRLPWDFVIYFTFPFHIRSRSNPVAGQFWLLILSQLLLFFTTIMKPPTFIKHTQGSINKTRQQCTQFWM